MHTSFSVSLLAVRSACGILGLACLGHGAMAFQVFKVGAGGDCPYHGIQDAVNAAAGVPGTDYVWIATNQVYNAQAIHVADPDGVIIEGGFTDCNDFDPELAQTSISGDGNGGQAIFTITGPNNIFLGNLYIHGANRDGDASGGGISFEGGGRLELARVTLSANTAGYGGGVNMKPSNGGFPILTVDDNTFILNNTAGTSGGGIRMEGTGRLELLRPATWIYDNHAPNGYGGGVELLGNIFAQIASPGFNGSPVIATNDAQYGGGIAAIGLDGSGEPTIDLYSNDSSHPVQISNNSASATGGGIYLKPNINSTVGERATLCARDFRINNNLAQEGAAIYADEDHDVLGYRGAAVILNAQTTVWGCGTTTLGQACDGSVPCNELVANINERTDDLTPTAGATILMQSDSYLGADRFSMRNNKGAHAIRVVSDAGSYFQLYNCLIVENQTTNVLINATPYSDDSHLIINNCTLAGNSIAGTHVIRSASNFVELTRSIVDQPGLPTLEAFESPGDITVHYVMSNDVTTLPDAPDIINDRAKFGGSDYRLTRCSRGIDFAPSTTGFPLDFSGQPRNTDLPSVPNHFGGQDLGAYEMQLVSVGDAIFCDGFD